MKIEGTNVSRHLIKGGQELIHTVLKQLWAKTKFIGRRGKCPGCVPQIGRDQQEGLLAQINKAKQRGMPDFRLCWSKGSNTVTGTWESALLLPLTKFVDFYCGNIMAVPLGSHPFMFIQVKRKSFFFLWP